MIHWFCKNCKRLSLSLLLVLLVGSFVFISDAESRRGCCSHRGGVVEYTCPDGINVGYRCRDGSPLSEKCAPYYPSCPKETTYQSPKPQPLPKDKPKLKDKSERFYQNVWCKQHDGETEEILSDRTICDCLTSTHAVEVDFARKWKEAIRQSLHYSRQTGKRAGIVLILETPKDRKYWDRLKSTIKSKELRIDTWCIGPGCR